MTLVRLVEDRWRTACVGLVIVSAFLLFAGLGNAALTDYDEATYGIIASNASVTGDYLTFRYLDSLWFEKPPLYFWMEIASGAIFSDQEFAYRFPSALMGVLSVLLVVLIGYQITRRYSVAFTAGALLLTTGAYFEAARQVRLDVPVTAALLLAFLSFLKARDNPLWFLGMGFAVGIGVLFKGPIGLLAGPLLLIWALTTRDFAWFKNGYFWASVLLAIAIIAPWHVYESLLYGKEFWFHYLGEHVLDRFSSNILDEASTGTNLTYINFLWAFAFPWSVLSVLSLAQVLRMRASTHFRPALALAMQGLFIVAIFFIAGTKIGYYLTPVYPFVALLIAVTAWTLFDELHATGRKILVALCAILIVAAIANMYIVGYRHHVAFADINSVAHDEKDVGLVIRDQDVSLPVYTYGFLSWETLIFYGGRGVNAMQTDQVLSQPFLLIIPRTLADSSPFPDELSSHLQPLYAGKALVLFRFSL